MSKENGMSPRSKLALLTINPQLALHRHLLFWLPIFIFGGLSCYAGWTTNNVDFSALKEPEKVMSALTYPLFILSFALPLTLAVGRFHASSQRAETIRVADSTMSFKHYFEHRDAFTTHVEKYSNIGSLGYKNVWRFEINDALQLYELMYPNATMSKFDILPTELTDDIFNSKVNGIIKQLDDYSSEFYLPPNISLSELFAPFGLKVIIEDSYLVEEVQKQNKRLKRLGKLRRDFNICILIERFHALLAHIENFDREFKRIHDKEKYIELLAASAKKSQLNTLAIEYSVLHVESLQRKSQTD